MTSHLLNKHHLKIFIQGKKVSVITLSAAISVKIMSRTMVYQGSTAFANSFHAAIFSELELFLQVKVLEICNSY